MKKLLTISILALYLTAFVPAISYAQSASCTGTPGIMSFSPGSGNVYEDTQGNITVDVIVNPAGCAAGAADVTVLYDTTKLQFSSTASKYVDQGASGNPANYFKNNIAINEVSPGTIRMSRYIDPGSTDYTTASGTFVHLVFKPLVAVGSTVTLSFNYQPGATDDFTTIAGQAQGSDLLGTANPATLTIAAGTPPVTTPTITSVSPNSGDRNLAQTVTINGTHFGTVPGGAKIGIAATIVSWSDTQIVVTSPTYSSITHNTPVDVSVTAGSQVATLANGYTYTVQSTPVQKPPLPGSGTDTQVWMVLAAVSLALTGLAYYKFGAKPIENL